MILATSHISWVSVYYFNSSSSFLCLPVCLFPFLLKTTDLTKPKLYMGLRNHESQRSKPDGICFIYNLSELRKIMRRKRFFFVPSLWFLIYGWFRLFTCAIFYFWPFFTIYLSLLQQVWFRELYLNYFMSPNNIILWTFYVLVHLDNKFWEKNVHISANMRPKTRIKSQPIFSSEFAICRVWKGEGVQGDIWLSGT